MPEWKDTVNLPRTDFPMKANLQAAEPEWLARGQGLGFYGEIAGNPKSPPQILPPGRPPRDQLPRPADRVSRRARARPEAARHADGRLPPRVPRLCRAVHRRHDGGV